MTRLFRLSALALFTFSGLTGCVVTTGSSNTEMEIQIYWDNDAGSYTSCDAAAVTLDTEYFIYLPGGTNPIISGRATPCADTLIIDREDDGGYLRGSYDIVITGRATDGTVWRSECGVASLVNGLVNVIKCDADISQTVIQLETYWDNSLGSFLDCDTSAVDNGNFYELYLSGGSVPVSSGAYDPCTDTMTIVDEDSGFPLIENSYEIVVGGEAFDGTKWYLECGSVYPSVGALNVVDCDVPITFP